MIPKGHVVIQYNADNPGVWPLHCHIAFHISQGLLQTNMERPDEIGGGKGQGKGRERGGIAETMRQTCRDWRRWEEEVEGKGEGVVQIDSGV